MHVCMEQVQHMCMYVYIYMNSIPKHDKRQFKMKSSLQCQYQVWILCFRKELNAKIYIYIYIYICFSLRLQGVINGVECFG